VGGVPPLTDEQLNEAVAARNAHPSSAAAARSLDLPRNTFSDRLKIAAQRGLMLDTAPAMPGYYISQVTDGPNGRSVQQKPEHGEVFEIPAGLKLKGVTALVDADGRVMHKHILARDGGADPLAIVEAIKEAFADYAPAAEPVPAPVDVSSDILTLIPLADWHLGMFAWGKETSENWDLKIAERVIGESVDAVIERSPPSGACVVLGGGDLIHSDSNENKTTRSGNSLQVDGRYQKVVGAACRLTERVVERARRRHEKVVVRILPGNHDEHACVAVAYHLAALYRNEPRVTVDLDPSVYWWFLFGRVLLGATHGHMVKISKMPGVMAQRRPEDWGATRFRYVHGFHIHHTEKIGNEIDGVAVETHQSPVPQDAWHFGSGYLSGRSLTAITYHREFGYRGRVTDLIMDGESRK